MCGLWSSLQYCEGQSPHSATSPQCKLPSEILTELLLQAVKGVGGVKTGNYTFTNPYDARVGVLLCPDVDWHVDKFQASFFIGVLFFTVFY